MTQSAVPTMAFPSLDWAYLYGAPNVSATFKRELDDFIVEENLGFALSGSGEHYFVQIEKRGLNTAYVAEQLAKYCQLSHRHVSFAGRKDKFAVTTQTFGIHSPKALKVDISEFALTDCKVISVDKHNKKLKTGALQGNRFSITLRDVSEPQALMARVKLIQQHGVPNYYGAQRFGEVRYRDDDGAIKTHLGGNLAMAEHLLSGVGIRHRNKRSMAISALRSWLFNTVINARIHAQCFTSPLAGDAFTLAGSNSFFVAQDIDDTLTSRLALRDIIISAPLAGKTPDTRSLGTQDAALEFESAVLKNYATIVTCLANLDCKSERRAIALYPSALSIDWPEANTAVLQFALPRGCFATSVLRELCHLEMG